MKRFKLEPLKQLNGMPFRKAVENEDGTPVLELRKDADGKPLMQMPRDAKGEPIPGTTPEPVYQIKTEPMGKETLGEVLKSFYLRMRGDEVTRQDNIFATTMFQNIAASKDGYLELDDNAHKWIREKLQAKDIEDKDGKVVPGVGLRLLGINLTTIENALDNFEKLHVPKEK